MSSVTQTEKALNRVSMVALVIGGGFFIYEGAVLIDMHRSNPSKVPKRIAVAGALTVFLGVLSLAFVLLHLFLDGTMASVTQALQAKATNTRNSNVNTTGQRG